MAENTTRQLDRWKTGDAITAYRLNQLVEAVNFLLNTTGYIFNRVALANYVPTDASSFNYPGILEAVETRAGLTAPRIEAGTLVLPEPTDAGLTAVTYDFTTQTPYISDGTLNLNLASFEPSSGSAYPGAIVGVKLYDPTNASSPSAPDITAGVLNLPAGIKSVTYDFTTQTPAISNGTLHLNLASFEPSTGSAYPGSIVGLNLYDPTNASSPSAPGITAGVLQLPAGLSAVENASSTMATQPSPGSDGWVQTLLIKGSYQNGSLQFERWDRQLMRLHGTTLQVVQQESFDDGDSWSDSSA